MRFIRPIWGYRLARMVGLIEENAPK